MAKNPGLKFNHRCAQRRLSGEQCGNTKSRTEDLGRDWEILWVRVMTYTETRWRVGRLLGDLHCCVKAVPKNKHAQTALPFVDCSPLTEVHRNV